ncbi:MAG: SDR family oxidoreductase [Ferroplasma sp.]
MYDIENKVCIVTGSGRGIGRAIAESLSAGGAKVLINVRKHIEEGERVVSELGNNGAAELSVADVSTKEGIDKLFDDCLDKLGKPDILVNNAGVGILEPFPSVSQKSIERMMSTNLYSAINASKKFSETASRGVIINIASLAGVVPFPGLSIYGITKAGLISLTHSLALELSGAGIRANAVAPGIVRTEMGEGLLKIMSMDENNYAKKYTLSGKIIEPDEVAATVMYLIENESMTGQVIEMDSGSMQMVASLK